MERIGILLVDDQRLFVESLQIVIETRAPDISIVSVARDGSEALAEVERHSPDVVLMDVRMPGLDGVQATRIIHSKYPSIRIIMLTTFDDDDYVFQAIRFGASGYLLKDMPPTELINSIRLANRGHVLLSPSVAQKMAQGSKDFAELHRSETGDDELKARYDALTPREKEVFRLIVDGFDNGEIAERLFLAKQTVKNHASEIYSKMEVPDRLHLIRVARELRLG